MAKNQSRRITSAVLRTDREAFDALQGIPDYAPANQAYKTEAVEAARATAWTTCCARRRRPRRRPRRSATRRRQESRPTG